MLCRIRPPRALYRQCPGKGAQSPCLARSMVSTKVGQMMADIRLAQISRRSPLIVVIGATGTGKSKLAVSIAKHLARSSTATNETPDGLAAEIINADAMQMYSGLPIITNKLSEEEQEGIPHHLLGRIGLKEDTWNINQFLIEADRCAESIKERARTPIVVGGTGYYVHGLLLGDSILGAENGNDQLRSQSQEGIDSDNDESYTAISPGTRHAGTDEIGQILDAPTAELFAKLQELDPEMARRWHPNDRRRIQRSLEICLKTGRKASEIYDTQQQNRTKLTELHDSGGDKSNILARYDALIFWLDAADAILKARLNDRVDAMVKAGLFGEAKAMADFERHMREEGNPVQRDRGIWASIGYKEVEPWLQHVESPRSDKQDKESVKLRDSCIEAVKAGTRQYAKRQHRYIRIRLANALTEAGLSDRLFLLDCSSLSKWDDMVETPATSIVDKFLAGEPLPKPADLSELASSTFSSMSAQKSPTERLARRCEICDKVLMNNKEWTVHVASRTHKRALERIKKTEMLRKLVQPVTADDGFS